MIEGIDMIQSMCGIEGNGEDGVIVWNGNLYELRQRAEIRARVTPVRARDFY